MSDVFESWVLSWWVLSLVAELGLLVRSFAWRRTYPRFTAYLAFDLAASVALFYVSRAHPSLYDFIWRTAQLLLIIGRVALVNEAYFALKTADTKLQLTRPWRPPVLTILSASMLCGSVLHWILQKPLVWPGAALEPIFALIGLSNAVMGFTLLGILSTTHQSLRRRTEYRHAIILAGYLLLTCAGYYSAARTIDRVGGALMIIAAFSYFLWAVVMSERRERRDDPSFISTRDYIEAKQARLQRERS